MKAVTLESAVSIEPFEPPSMATEVVTLPLKVNARSLDTELKGKRSGNREPGARWLSECICDERGKVIPISRMSSPPCALRRS